MSNSNVVQEEREVLGFSEKELCESYFIIIKSDFLKTVGRGGIWPKLVFHSPFILQLFSSNADLLNLDTIDIFFLIFSGKRKLFCALQSVLKHPWLLAPGYQQHFPYHGIKNVFGHFQVSSGMGGLNVTWCEEPHISISLEKSTVSHGKWHDGSQTSVSHWYHTDYSYLDY